MNTILYKNGYIKIGCLAVKNTKKSGLPPAKDWKAATHKGLMELRSRLELPNLSLTKRVLYLLSYRSMF